MEIPATLQLKVGEMVTLTLPGLATAGYLWRYEIAQPDTAVIDVAKVDERSESMVVGSSSSEAITIRAIQPGCARLRLVQQRSWEWDQPPLNEHSIEIVVR